MHVVYHIPSRQQVHTNIGNGLPMFKTMSQTSLKVVEMHIWSSDWKRVVVIITSQTGADPKDPQLKTRTRDNMALKTALWD